MAYGPSDVSHVDGPACQILEAGRRRTGTPKWWCIAHQSPAWADRTGERLDVCRGADVPIPEPTDIALDEMIEWAFWGAVQPVLDTAGTATAESGVHVHLRRELGGTKVVDETFPAVRVMLGDHEPVVLRARELVAMLPARVFGFDVVALDCPRCGGTHLDEDFFAVNAHRKHLCSACGREFFDRTGRSISNPAHRVSTWLGQAPAEPIEVDRELHLDAAEVEKLQLWGSNPAVIRQGGRPEEAGIHVHAYDTNGARTVDDTFSVVEVSGLLLTAEEVRTLMVQRSLPHLAPRVTTVLCTTCGAPAFDTNAEALRPHRDHLCRRCGTVNVTRSLVVSNPAVATVSLMARQFPWPYAAQLTTT